VIDAKGHYVFPGFVYHGYHCSCLRRHNDGDGFHQQLSRGGPA
jgi:hypothetical protein